MGVDRVRLGRALGYGTRHAAKTFAAVVEAAAAPEAGRNSPPQGSADFASRATPGDRKRTTPPGGGLGAGVSNFKRSFWHPLATFSGALWLRVTGLFFALLAVTMAGGGWRLLHAGTGASHRLWLFVSLAALFFYFAISSFVRAHLKERGAASGGSR